MHSPALFDQDDTHVTLACSLAAGGVRATFRVAPPAATILAQFSNKEAMSVSELAAEVIDWLCISLLLCFEHALSEK
jgi:hypothetical protein